MRGVPTYIDFTMSAGSSAYGGQYAYLRPNYDCFNRSRRIGTTDPKLFWDKIDKAIEKWYAPMINLYLVDGHIIGSNSAENALKEYWRVCDWHKRKQRFEVELIK